MIRDYLFLGILLLASQVHGQNLVPNPDFESFTTCPVAFNGICNGYAQPWNCPTAGSSDYFHACGNMVAGVPVNAIGNQPARSGNAYAGFGCSWLTGDLREYLYVPLTQALDAGSFYYVSFYVNRGESGCAIEHIGAYLSETAPLSNILTNIEVTPQVESAGELLDDPDEWYLISACIQATGGEQFLTIGNFRNDANTHLEPNCNDLYSYYYVDDVSVIEVIPPEEFFLELGDPVFACFSYVIDPMLGGSTFLWSDGSNGPTLTVTQTGVYALTISDGCNYAVDSIEVTIAGNFPPVDLGPDEAVICTGSTYTISLDPTLSTYVWQNGSNEPEYTITSPGLYSVTLDDGCLSTSDDIFISFLDPPSPFSLGPDDLICPGEVIEYFFDPDLGQFLWQDNSTSSDYTISDEGTYQLIITNMCGSISDEIEITALEPPIVDLGPDTLVICDGTVTHLEIDPQSGEIAWQDGSTSTDYLIEAPGLYSVMISNECGVATDTMTVFVEFAPNVSLGADSILCPGESITLFAETLNTTYLWQDHSTADSLVVSTAGTYSITVTNDCGIDADTIVIMATAALTPVAFGPDVNICPGEQIILYATNPNANYLWQDSSTLDSFVVNDPGTYTLIEYNICSMTSDTMVVVINGDPPHIDLPPSYVLCFGDSIILDAAISGVDYLWSDHSQHQQLIVHTPGEYSLTVSNACGMDVDTVLITDGGPAPSVELGNDAQLCPGDIILLTPVFSDVTSWLWHDGSMASTYTITTAGLIHVEASNACGTAFDTIQASLLPATPLLDLGADTSICLGASFALSIQTPGVTIEWPDGSNGTDYIVSGAGAVFASITNNCGASFDTILVMALPEIPTLDLGLDQSLCPGEMITLNPGIPNVQYLWQDGSTGNTYQSTQEETVILSITNECGTSTDTVVITESTQGPQLDLGPDIQVCAGDTVTIQSGISGVNFTWQDGSTNPEFRTSQSGLFILQVINNCGTDTDTIVVDISGIAPTPMLPADTILCEGNSMTLISMADAETTIAWQDGSSSPTFIVTTGGVFTLSESNRCGNMADTITVSYLEAPDPFTLGPDTTLCPGESLTLNAPSTPYALEWQDGSHETSFVAHQAATYSLQISNACGTVSDNLVFNFDTDVPQLHLDTPIPWCEGDIITLDATQSFAADYHWSTGATTSSVEILQPGQYTVDVITPCITTTQDVEVYPATDCHAEDIHDEIFIPNVFSPDHNGINDMFSLSFGSDIHVTAMSGSIFDRWGNLVYSSEAVPFQWNGLYRDKELMPGVYVYLIKCTYLIGNTEMKKVFSGDVTLIR